ncbi:ABC transporter permease [Candidatus Woesearchaeota archaeon]|nr:ABC transporter permease [Candidatus Woesearchaeota archaeon]MBW3006148.1 ABC transporter permease [Candidatus Woesearchaeota archaeon]
MKLKRSSVGELATLVKKNIKLLVRARSSALIVIFGPLLVIFLAGIAFDNTNLYAVKVGTFSEQYNDLSNSFIDKLTAKQFKVVRYPDAVSCNKGIEIGEVNTCLVFAPDFTLAQNGSNAITFYVDYSKINLVWTILNVMTESISERSMELSRNLTTILVDALETSTSEIVSKKPALIQLTTANDESGRRITDVSVRLEEVALDFNPNEYGADELASAKKKVQHWVDNSLSLGQQALSKAKSSVDALGDTVPGSGLSDAAKENLIASLEQRVADMNELQDRLDTTESLVSQESKEFDTAIDSLIGKLTQTKTALDQAASERDTSLDELATVRELLDTSLKNLLNLQRTFNNIEKMVNAVEVTDPSAVVQPVVTHIKPITTEKSYLNYITPILIVLILSFTALLLAPTLILLEKNSSAYFRNYMMPVKEWIFILATFLSSFLVLMVQLVIILAISAIVFSSQFFSGMGTTLAILIMLSSIFIFMGMIIGYLFNSEETAMLAGISVGSAMLFMSDIIIPIESMPSFMYGLAQYSPLVLGGTLLRGTMLYNATFIDIGAKFFILVFYFVLFGVLAFASFYAAKDKKLAKKLGLKIKKFVPKRKKKDRLSVSDFQKSKNK